METTAEISTAALSSYLADHLAGSAAGIEMAQRLVEHKPGDELLSGLVSGIEADQETLKRLMVNVGASESSFKTAGALAGEKLGAGVSGIEAQATEGLGVLRMAEMLTMGITGKVCLWEALQELSGADDRLSGFDFERLAQDARGQLGDLAEARKKMSRKAFLH